LVDEISPVGLLFREDAIRHLKETGFTLEEAINYLDEPVPFERDMIARRVEARMRRGDEV